MTARDVVETLWRWAPEGSEAEAFLQGVIAGMDAAAGDLVVAGGGMTMPFLPPVTVDGAVTTPKRRVASPEGLERMREGAARARAARAAKRAGAA